MVSSGPGSFVKDLEFINGLVEEDDCIMIMFFHCLMSMIYTYHVLTFSTNVFIPITLLHFRPAYLFPIYYCSPCKNCIEQNKVYLFDLKNEKSSGVLL